MKLFAVSFLLLAGLALASTKCDVIPPPVKGSKRCGSGPWVYTKGASNGPKNWHKVHCTDYEKCSAENETQSPIDIQEKKAKKGDSEDKPKIKPVASATMMYEPTANNFEFLCEHKKKCGKLTVDGDKYYLHQVHFHAPSENTLSGKRFDMEIHFVHTREEEVTVFGVFLEGGEEKNEVFQNFLDLAATRKSGEVNIKTFLKDVLSEPTLYTFEGSLTTPPCTGGVNWIVSKKVLRASKDQIEQFKKMMGYIENFRPLQDNCERELSVFA